MIRVNALSPGPIPTRAASGIDHFDALMEMAASRPPQHRLVSIDDVGVDPGIGIPGRIDDVGHLAAFLVSDAAQAITGTTVYVDAGFHAAA